MDRVLVATGLPNLDDAILKIDGFEYVPVTIGYKKDIFEACANFSPDVLIVTEKLSGPEILSGILIGLKQKKPNIRIIYLAGAVNLSDSNRVNKLGAMVMAGIYDIITEKVINKSLIEDILLNPRRESDVEYLLRYFVERRRDSDSNIEYEEEIEDNYQGEGYENVYMISSLKPGSGKSFVASNVATIIAKFGEKKDGVPPRVAIIEADLQTLSLGTLLSIEDDKHNLKTVMNKIATVVDDKGNVSNDDFKKNIVDEYILSSFKQYSKCKSLYALVGSQLNMNELEDVSPYYYAYLISVVSKNFDIVIIDSNSSLNHVTTYPLLTMSRNCYYIVNMDFNAVRNNQRYRVNLKELGIYDKAKFILNEDLSNQDLESPEILEFNVELLEESFVLEAKIPAIDKVVFLNRIWRGTPCVLDNSEATLKARYEICKIANQIYPMDSYLNWLKGEVDKNNLSKKGKHDKKMRLFRR